MSVIRCIKNWRKKTNSYIRHVYPLSINYAHIIWPILIEHGIIDLNYVLSSSSDFDLVFFNIKGSGLFICSLFYNGLPVTNSIERWMKG